MPDLRRAAVEDVPALLDVFFEAVDDRAARQDRPAPRPSPGALEQIVRHLLKTDPASALVAADGDGVVAFGMLHVRGPDAFLAFLFVLPRRQAGGVGRAVLRGCLAAAGHPRRVGVCVDADQPVATGLYASLGMAPRAPLYMLRGRPRPEALPALPEGWRMRPLDVGAGDGIDERLLGYRRPADHAFWRASQRQGWQLEDRGGRFMGYGYAQASGRVGPVAASDPALLPVILGQLARRVDPVEGWQVVVPGPCTEGWQALLGCGLRIDATPAVYCAGHAGPSFDRYLPMSFALL